MFFRRYWRIAALSLPIGFGLGWLVFLWFVFAGNPDWRSHLTPGEFVRSSVGYGLVGIALAGAALLGGGVAVAMRDRRLKRAASSRILWAAIGAWIGVVVLGLVLQVAGGLLGGLAQSGTFAIYLALFLAFPAGGVAAALVAVAESSAKRSASVDDYDPLAERYGRR